MERVISSERIGDDRSILRLTLIGDAVVVAATGLLMFAIAGRLSAWLDLPVDLLRWPGLFLIVYAAAVGWYSTRARYARSVILVLITVNLAWAVGCLIVLASGEVDPNGFGTGFVVLNAAACLVVAALEITHMPD